MITTSGTVSWTKAQRAARLPEVRALQALGVRRCCHCQIIKPFDEFHKARGKRLGQLGRCKQCRHEEALVYYHERGGKAKGRQYYLNRRDHYSRHNYETRIKREYGLDETVLARLLQQQNHRCGICRRRFEDAIGIATKSRRRWHLWDVDHDHKTGKLRGLLCHRCNTALGLLGDGHDSEIIGRMLQWISPSPV